jgi:hypothetical protein
MSNWSTLRDENRVAVGSQPRSAAEWRSQGTSLRCVPHYERKGCFRGGSWGAGRLVSDNQVRYDGGVHPVVAVKEMKWLRGL